MLWEIEYGNSYRKYVRVHVHVREWSDGMGVSRREWDQMSQKRAQTLKWNNCPGYILGTPYFVHNNNFIVVLTSQKKLGSCCIFEAVWWVLVTYPLAGAASVRLLVIPLVWWALRKHNVCWWWLWFRSSDGFSQMKASSLLAPMFAEKMNTVLRASPSCPGLSTRRVAQAGRVIWPGLDDAVHTVDFVAVSCLPLVAACLALPVALPSVLLCAVCFWPVFRY